MTENIKITIDILPFGYKKFAYFYFREQPKEKEEPVYAEPSSTSIDRVEILYEEAEEYVIPKTTDGA